MTGELENLIGLRCQAYERLAEELGRVGEVLSAAENRARALLDRAEGDELLDAGIVRRAVGEAAAQVERALARTIVIQKSLAREHWLSQFQRGENSVDPALFLRACQLSDGAGVGARAEVDDR